MPEQEDEPEFEISIEDCERWSGRLKRMAKALESQRENEDGAKMFYTASVLVKRLSLDLQQEALAQEAAPLFGKIDIGEA